MTIEYLDKHNHNVKIKSIDEMPKDLSSVSSVQLIDYSKNDIIEIEKLFGIDTSILSNSDDIEISSHYAESEDQLAFNFSFPYYSSHNKIEEMIVSFILKEDIMFSFMAVNFEQFISETKKHEYLDKMKKLPFTLDSFLRMLIGIVPDYYADLTEVISKNIKTIYHNSQQRKAFSEKELDELTAQKFDNYLIRESLNEFRRILLLLKKSTKLSPQIKETIIFELEDLTVINEYVVNNFERLEDLKDYVANKIDLEQNRIFKTLTIITTCISLPMLIAGIYGMNFKYMPELEWKYGYIYAAMLLLFCFVVPLLWFKRKKWL